MINWLQCPCFVRSISVYCVCSKVNRFWLWMRENVDTARYLNIRHLSGIRLNLLFFALLTYSIPSELIGHSTQTTHSSIHCVFIVYRKFYFPVERKKKLRAAKRRNVGNKCNKIEGKSNLIIWRTFPFLLSFAVIELMVFFLFSLILFYSSGARSHSPFSPIVNYRFSLDGIFIANNQFCRCLAYVRSRVLTSKWWHFERERDRETETIAKFEQ